MHLKAVGSWLLALLVKFLKRRWILVVFIASAFLISLRWSQMCSALEPQQHIQNLCSSYESGQSVGNLCQDLCGTEGISSLSCHNHYQKKDAVFSGTWKNHSVVFKSVKKTLIGIQTKLHDSKKAFSSEDIFSNMIKTTVKLKFNISINGIDARRMSHYSKEITNKRSMEMENIWALFQDNEYLALLLCDKFDIFPKLFGTCGPLYAVQKLNSVSGYWHLMTLYDSRNEWVKRINISLMIMDLLLHLENVLSEPLHICDVKLNHFGVTDDFKKMMYVNLDSVHPYSVASRITNNGSKCKRHSDCDFLDCRSFCNLITFKCQHGVVNNNLQVVCERIFLGWVMSGRVVVPGLLLGPRTPGVLIELLEFCANPASETDTPRAPATKEIRKRLYDLLVNLKSS